MLGLQWNTFDDILSLKSLNFDLPSVVTKRIVVSLSSKMFDPLGFMSPVSIKAKMFIQDLWSQNIGWDTPLDNDLVTIWIDIMHELCK